MPQVGARDKGAGEGRGGVDAGAGGGAVDGERENKRKIKG